MPTLCAEHVWASIGVSVLEDQVTRVWACEHCPAWTRERLDDEYEIAWQQTWLAEM